MKIQVLDSTNNQMLKQSKIYLYVKDQKGKQEKKEYTTDKDGYVDLGPYSAASPNGKGQWVTQEKQILRYNPKQPEYAYNKPPTPSYK